MSRHRARAALRVSLSLVVTALVLAGFLLALHQWRVTALPQQALLPTKFEHFDHVATQCVECHHNWVDETGSGPCYNCHKTDPQVNIEMEPMFHDFCWGCHIEKRLDPQEEEAGPVRECSLCHPGS
tara:strand:+ start:133809 stop:134186 length:378 start_codon:yes stop_codon:yes gene_type:complete